MGEDHLLLCFFINRVTFLHLACAKIISCEVHLFHFLHCLQDIKCILHAFSHIPRGDNSHPAVSLTSCMVTPPYNGQRKLAIQLCVMYPCSATLGFEIGDIRVMGVTCTDLYETLQECKIRHWLPSTLFI